MLNGVAVSPKGRVFASFPRWTSLEAPSVMEATPRAVFMPYPGGAWNGLVAGRLLARPHRFEPRGVRRLVEPAVDRRRRRPARRPGVPGAAKLVSIDLATDRVSRVYSLERRAPSQGDMIGHMR